MLSCLSLTRRANPTTTFCLSVLSVLVILSLWSFCLSGYEELLPLRPVSHIRSVCLDTRPCYHYGQFYTFGLFAWIRGTATIMASFTHSVCLPGYEELLPLWPVLHIRSPKFKQRSSDEGGCGLPFSVLHSFLSSVSRPVFFCMIQVQKASLTPSLPASQLAVETIRSVPSNTHLC